MDRFEDDDIGYRRRIGWVPPVTLGTRFLIEGAMPTVELHDWKVGEFVVWSDASDLYAGIVWSRYHSVNDPRAAILSPSPLTGMWRHLDVPLPSPTAGSPITCHRRWPGVHPVELPATNGELWTAFVSGAQRGHAAGGKVGAPFWLINPLHPPTNGTGALTNAWAAQVVRSAHGLFTTVGNIGLRTYIRTRQDEEQIANLSSECVLLLPNPHILHQTWNGGLPSVTTAMGKS